MRNIKLIIQYDGTNYNGWQLQRAKNQKLRAKTKTIQREIEKALRKILCEQVKLIGSGRTDAGVHALGQVANFITDSTMVPIRIKKGLNAILADDIVIKEAREVDIKFHARFCARSKIYRYTILNRDYRSVFEQRYSLFIPYKLDVGLMKKEADCLLGRHDFKSFQATQKNEKPSVRTLKAIEISRHNDFIFLDFEADGFLYKMIRNIVGTLIEIGRGRFESGSLKRILDAKNRKLAGKTAPARGLCLLKVKY
jgi:tRNA pseudouridine38-40 synthase